MGVMLDIDMPKGCWYCPCYDGENGFCKVTLNSVFRDRPQNCPMKELPDESINIIGIKK